MPRPTNETDANTLPDPELNPLLNPLLAAHMGRWAEVYFTNPPEKRGQAIAELLRELENISPPESASVEVMQESVPQKSQAAEIADSVPATVETSLTCGACGHNNAAGQRFCGMCGSPLQGSPQAHVEQAAEAAPITGTSWVEPESFFDDSPVEYATEPTPGSTPAIERPATQHRMWPLPEESIPRFAVEPEPVPYRYRLYIGVVLAILLAVLIYMAWRGTEAFSGAATPQSSPSKATTPLPTAPANSEQPPSPAKSNLPGKNPPASQTQSQSQPDATAQKEQVADAPRIVPITASSLPPAVAEASGAEDLAMAEMYLNGSAGMQRDSKEAAQWLWKAVRKQNLAATMELSDLYLRGDGVAKNCDQARVLLDAAARKGATAAAERLRNLRAFGCE